MCVFCVSRALYSFREALYVRCLKYGLASGNEVDVGWRSECPRWQRPGFESLVSPSLMRSQLPTPMPSPLADQWSPLTLSGDVYPLLISPMKLPCLTRPTGCLLHTVATHQHCWPALRHIFALRPLDTCFLSQQHAETLHLWNLSGDRRWLSNAGMKVWAPNCWIVFLFYMHVSNKNQEPRLALPQYTAGAR